MATDFTFLIPLGWDRRADRIAFARRHELGLEISAFVGGKGLNDTEVREVMEEELAEELADFSGMKTLHGAFLDLSLHSMDDRIAAISQSRIERDILSACRLGCDKIVFHLGLNPLVTVARYADEIINAQAAFWTYALASYPGITICLENQWEADWTVFEELLDAVNDPRFGVCLDVAHVNVNSHFSPEAWIQRLGSRILHSHWNDNHGDRDSHQPLGTGCIDWAAILEACRVWNRATVTLEMNEQSALERSLAFLGRQGVAVRPRRAPTSVLPAVPV